MWLFGCRQPGMKVQSPFTRTYIQTGQSVSSLNLIIENLRFLYRMSTMKEYWLVSLERHYLESYTLDLFLSAENHHFVIYKVAFVTILSPHLVTLPSPKRDFPFQPSKQNLLPVGVWISFVLTVVMIQCIYLYVYLSKNNKVSSSHSHVSISS